uniref:Putative radical SAM superfamily protein n=1 Tax=viral metagenome TaxID=1070528 RepID=A0A6M3J9N4_9ZZZZ
MKIGYLTVPSGKLGDQPNQYGLNVVANAAVSAGFSPEQIDRKSDISSYDVIMVGLYWWEHLINLVKFFGASGLLAKNTKRPVVIVGGQNAALNPLPISPIIDYAVAVDGEAVIGDLLLAIGRGDREPDLPGVWWPGRGSPSDAVSADRLVYFPHVQFSGRMTTDGEDKLRSVTPVSFVEIGRGCPHHCRFCALSSIKPYRELPFSEVARAVRRSRTKQMRVFAPERSAHRHFVEIEKYVRDQNRINVSVDIRLESIHKLSQVGNVQFGIEGLSGRLRHAVGKKLNREDLASSISAIWKTPTYHKPNHMNADTYLIGGLPGEAPSDYEEFADDLNAINGRVDPGFALKMTINWFIPQPFTPLQFAPVDPWAPWRKDAWFNVCHGKNRNRFQFKIKQMQSLVNPTKWLTALAVTRGDETHWPLIRAMALDKAAGRIIRKNQDHEFLRLCERAGLSEDWLVGELPTDGALPWEGVWSHPRAEPGYTRRQWARYKEVMSGYQK